ncbi:unnamed protein product [Ectocarpus sp. 6 AP-2014]
MVGSAMNPAAALVGPPSLHVQVIRHTSTLPLCSFAGSSRLRWQDDTIGHSSSGASRRGSARWSLRPSAAAADAADEGADYEGRLDNPRRPVPNEYLAGWALTQNDTACLQRFQDMDYTDCGDHESSPEEAKGEKAGFRLWGEATKALMDRVDIVHDLDQRRLAASRYWQRLQSTPPKEAPASNTGNKGKFTDLDLSPGLAAPTWADVDALFESDNGFVRRESERYIEEAREGMPSEGGWSGDRVSRQWVASYRLSVFETRRQAQRFFSWGIPDEGALDCILEPGKRVLEVGSGLGYWAYLLKLRSGDDSRVRCFDPFAPPARQRTEVSTTEDESGYSVEEAPPRSIENVPSPEPISMREEEVDDWFGEGREPFSPAERGSFDRIAREDGFRKWSLLICWPSDGQWPAGCLQEFAGNDFFYVGEGEGGATRMPWLVLREEWELVRRVEIPTWPGFRDALWWYTRKEPGALSRDR